MSMKISKFISAFLWLFIPIWYYLTYKILESINANELMWFLYWAYVPVGIICGVILNISDESDK